MVLLPELRQFIAENRSADDIRQLAIAEGMTTLRQSGVEKAKEGITTLEEILRVCLRDD
jgi:type II secretory ATPase GspE/PulE/Tfp pilus assembly ATPase PilB-like protein